MPDRLGAWDPVAAGEAWAEVADNQGWHQQPSRENGDPLEKGRVDCPTKWREYGPHGQQSNPGKRSRFSVAAAEKPPTRSRAEDGPWV